MKTRAELTGAIAALKALKDSHADMYAFGNQPLPLRPVICLSEVEEEISDLRAQLAALPEEPPQPWTDRERRLREALEKIAAPVREDGWTCLYCGDGTAEDPCESPCPRFIAKAALAEAPPPDAIDCPKCGGWAETTTGHDCDRCGATGEVAPPPTPEPRVMRGKITRRYESPGVTLPNDEPDQRDEALEMAEKALRRLTDTPHREDHMEVCFDWCPRCKVEDALAAIARAKGGVK